MSSKWLKTRAENAYDEVPVYWTPNLEDLIMVREMSAMGVSFDQIYARVTMRNKAACGKRTFRKLCGEYLDAGLADANLAVARSLFVAATSGDVRAQIFWLKSRAGWRDNDPTVQGAPVSHTQVNITLGGVEQRTVSALIEAQSYMSSSIPPEQWPERVRALAGLDTGLGVDHECGSERTESGIAEGVPDMTEEAPDPAEGAQDVAPTERAPATEEEGVHFPDLLQDTAPPSEPINLDVGNGQMSPLYRPLSTE